MNRQFFFLRSLWFVNVLSWWLFVVIKINVIRIKLRLLIKSLVKDAIKHVIIEFLILICMFCFQKMKSNFMHKIFECFFFSRFYLAPYNVTIYSSFTHVYHTLIDLNRLKNSIGCWRSFWKNAQNKVFVGPLKSWY